MPTIQELVQIFQRETGFDRLFSLFREKYRSYERVGQNVKVNLPAPTLHEKKVLEGFFGESFEGHKTITISVAKFQRAIKNTIYKDVFENHDINDILSMYYNGDLTSKKQDEYIFNQLKELFFQNIINNCELGSSFHLFLVFIQEHNSAVRIHAMYKSNSKLLRRLLELIANLFACLPLNEYVYLPMLARELTGDSHALDPHTDGGKIALYALQVINHINHGVDIQEKLTPDQMMEIFLGHHILFCLDTNSENNFRLLLKKSDEELEETEKVNELIVLKKIGSGAFAKVYRVFDPELGTEMACKILYGKSHFRQVYGKDGDEYLLRFQREVRILQRELHHPNVISLDKVQLDRAPFWFTMPVADSSLEAWLENHPNATEEMRLSIFKQILEGTGYLHDCNISHRDLAPNNILLFREFDGSLTAKIADFGLVKDHQSLSFLTRLSINGYGRGGFTAPEQLKSLAESDHLSDIYSLGALLYYVLSGQYPERRFAVPIKYQFIVAKAMENERSERYQSVTDFIKALEDSMQRRGSNEAISYNSLTKYEFTDASNDVPFVLNLMSEAKVEPYDKVYELFFEPLLSIPKVVLKECCRYELVMIPFMEIIRENTENLYYNTADCTQEEWQRIILQLEILSSGIHSEALQLSVIELFLHIALEFRFSLAQQLVGQIIESLPTDGRIADMVAYILEKDFLSHHDILIEILEGKDYPMPIRFALNDY